jgi:phage tail-like protein
MSAPVRCQGDWRGAEQPGSPVSLVPIGQRASNAPWLPPVPRPPHDPLTVLLRVSTGWRTLAGGGAGVAPALADGALTLTPVPGSGRRFGDGSLGGLVLPPQLAWVPDGGPCRRTLVLYHAGRGALLRFDRCRCCFAEWFCWSPQDVRRPQLFAGLASQCVDGPGHLFLLDRGRRVVLVLHAGTGALRGVWRPATGTWQPTAIAAGAHGSVWVADAASGELLRFARSGRVEQRVPGAGAVQTIAFDAGGETWIVRADGSAWRLAAQGFVPVEGTPAWQATRFSPLPVGVAAEGAVEAGALCLPPCSDLWFDALGCPLEAPPAAPGVAWADPGRLVLGPLDSGIAECVWDRLTLQASLPEHAGIRVQVLTADTLLPGDVVLEQEDWVDALLQVGSPGGGAEARSDTMLQASPGRWLWLRLELRAIGAAPRIAALEIDYPRISWRRYLPAVFGAEPTAAEFTDRWLAVFDQGFRGIEAQVDRQARLFDPASAPPEFLDFLARWIGATQALALPLARRRDFVKHAARAYAWRGTAAGLTHVLDLYLGLARWRGWQGGRAGCVPCTQADDPRFAWRPPRLLLEHHQLRRWLFLGAARLSDHARLWGTRIVNRSRLGGPQDDAFSAREGAQLGVTQLITSQDPWRDPLHVYAHQLSVFVPASCVRTPSLQRGLAMLLALEAPAHVKVKLLPVRPCFRVGVQSSLGLDAVVGWQARPATLDDPAAPLGRGTVLGAAEGPDQGGRSLRVGTRRVGMTTVLQ